MWHCETFGGCSLRHAMTRLGDHFAPKGSIHGKCANESTETRKRVKYPEHRMKNAASTGRHDNTFESADMR